MTAAGGWRRHRAALGVGLVVLVAVVVAALASGAPDRPEPLDPDNPFSDGGQALARVLADRGIDVTVVRSADELDATRLDRSTTLLVTGTDALGTHTAARLRAHPGSPTVVYAEPGPGAADVLEIPSGLPVLLDGQRSARCSDARLDDLEIAVELGTEYPTPTGCFEGEDGYLLATIDPNRSVLGASRILSNDQILRADNAAAAVRLLGSRDRLVWYVPSISDVPPGDGVSLSSLLPPWIGQALWLLGLAGLALLIWRGRRLGPLAVEPLPVAPKAVETTQSRGRLYRKADDRGHAAAALRAAARRDLADLLGLTTAAHQDADALAGPVAAQTGRGEDEIRRLLDAWTAPPTTNHDLIALAADLAELEREVRRR